MNRFRLTIQDLQGGEPFVFETDDFTVHTENEYISLRSNPAMFAALAGAPPDVTANLPGETMEYIPYLRHVTITFDTPLRSGR